MRSRARLSAGRRTSAFAVIRSAYARSPVRRVPVGVHGGHSSAEDEPLPLDDAPIVRCQSEQLREVREIAIPAGAGRGQESQAGQGGNGFEVEVGHVLPQLKEL